MGRTKQTARKTQNGKTPRKLLGESVFLVKISTENEAHISNIKDKAIGNKVVCRCPNIDEHSDSFINKSEIQDTNEMMELTEKIKLLEESVLRWRKFAVSIALSRGAKYPELCCDDELRKIISFE
jgi:hypothetical protein